MCFYMCLMTSRLVCRHLRVEGRLSALARLLMSSRLVGGGNPICLMYAVDDVFDARHRRCAGGGLSGEGLMSERRPAPRGLAVGRQIPKSKAHPVVKLELLDDAGDKL